MPIEAPTLLAAARKLQEHLNGLLTRTITETRLVAVALQGAPRVLVTFRQAGKPIFAPLRTRFDTFHLSLRQICEGIPGEGGGVQLQTVIYAYTLTPLGAREPAFRWEYEKRPQPGFLASRHHLQGEIPLPPPFGISLNKLHVPTGYTLIEDIIRFCIVDLGVSPLSGAWDRLLQESEDVFKHDFAPPTDRR